ncbi:MULTISPECIES: translocation/assembly module TamB domain-containing protein [unclassified Acinetobacter]|uniref:translocation/assembly module TamB domain-containing protein n=1 Tax=unclassified Acinetobacter TaxID=196816 RepID=UPI002934AD24|nr:MULTISPECIES: translocation/assembly module TamB domain-containing protein [unclassified Acinetobacter]WOE32562.1 translocation/assembly module TamB domain-containing protein [Acinetobacter sp. SAAs470]WOE38037.1 translocation/assembly module TamB domain-containing protein [Acinetobacter sp. SAAs474]
MAEVQQQLETPTPPQPKRKILKSILYVLLFVLVFVIAALALMVSTDRGSKFLLDRVLENQKTIHYEYEGGNLLRGVILKNILVTLKSVDVKIDRADVALGWRAILQKEIHLYRADVENLKVIMKGPPSQEPFKFDDIRLPFTLRLDQANLNHLLIQTATDVKVDFYSLHLEDALWQDTRLSFKNTYMDMGYLNVRNARGFMDFTHQGRYPLFVRADLNIPALNDSLNIHDITVMAKGSLDTVRAGFATQTPDMLTGWGVLHPLRDAVPMKGAVKLKQYHLPFLTEQKLLVKQGKVDFSGNIHRLTFALNSDLSGQDIPSGQYQAVMSTDLVNQLNIHQFNGQLMQGTVKLAGQVNWQKYVNWNVKGHLDRLNLNDKIIPAAIKDFLPPDLNANIASTGNLQKGIQLKASIDFDQYEQWDIDFKQNPAQANKAAPMLLNAHWRNFNRAVPYIGWLNSPTGDVQVQLLNQQQNIQLNTQITQHEKSLLPQGQYQAQLSLNNDDLKIPSFRYLDGRGGLTGQARIQLPTERKTLKWTADLNASQFNPQRILASAPVNLINGNIKANGYAKPNQQIIKLNAINLSGHLAEQNETVQLLGKSTVALIFDDEKSGGAFKSFAVDYDGALKASALPASQGYLKAVVAGTSNYIKIQQLYHDGAAGKIAASGLLNLNRGVGWDINASLVRFKPHYFMQGLNGEISGVVRSEGVWSDALKRVAVSRLNLAGTLNGKPIRGTGNLALILDAKDKGLVPQKFEANNLFLVYAQNKMQASGNAQSLKIKIDAPALNELYAGLKGRIYGYLDVQSQPRLKAIANLAVDNFRLNNLFSIKQIRIQGELPTSETRPTQLVATMDSLRKDNREIQKAQILVEGTRKAHILKLSAENKYSQLYVQLAGGFNAQNNWLGQIQKGDFDSFKTHLTQVQNASIIYNTSQNDLWVGAHCWASTNSQLCFDQPIKVSAQAGNVSFVTENLDLSDFSAFMPEGLAITGKVNGFAKAAWAQNQKPKIDVKVITRNGKIGLTDQDVAGVSSSLSYDQVALIAKSVSDGLQLRLDVKTPAIGTGYANVVIDPYSENKNMRGDIAFYDVNLKVFKPFIPDVRKLGGILSFAGKVHGSLTQPLMTGDLRLKNGEISMMSLPVNLTNIQLYSAIRQDSASITGAFNSGRGVGRLTGGIDWKTEPKVVLNLKGNNLLVRQAPFITALVQPDMSLEAYPLQKKVKVVGEVVIPKALISMPESTVSAIDVSPDVRVVYDGQDQLAVLRAAKPWSIETKIDLKLGNQVIFQGLDSRFPLVGRLYLTQVGTEAAMRANGAIGVSQRVKFEAYGQSLELTRAIARFNGPLTNPTLDMDANKMIQGNIVGVRVSGTASSPNIQIYNNAGLSEQEALNALLTGRINNGSSSLSTTAGFKSDVSNTIAAAGLSMGLGGTRALTNQIGRTFGLSGLSLDAQGQGDDTQVSLTGYITPDLFVRYGVGVFSSVNTLTMRYQLNQRFYLEASQSLEKAIDFFYNWRF